MKVYVPSGFETTAWQKRNENGDQMDETTYWNSFSTVSQLQADEGKCLP